MLSFIALLEIVLDKAALTEKELRNTNTRLTIREILGNASKMAFIFILCSSTLLCFASSGDVFWSVCRLKGLGRVELILLCKTLSWLGLDYRTKRTR